MIWLKKYKWHHSSSASIVGTLWINGSPLSMIALDELLSTLNSFEQFVQLIQQLQGQFCLVKTFEGEYWVATDPIANYPLFHRNKNSRIEITDDPIEMMRREPHVPNREALQFFMQFGSTFGDCTLVDGLQLFEPGTVTKLSEKGSYTEHYLKGYFSNKDFFDYTPLGLKTVLDEIFMRYIKHYENRPFVVPLTAGYDSRLIVAMLKKQGIENVYCFTWGRGNNPEVATARKVAEKLGYPYHFIEYDCLLIKNFRQSEQFERYIDYAGNYLSMPYLQDYFAVSYLKENQMVPADAVFIPGHTGDGYAGSHLRPWYENLSKKAIGNEIIDHFATTGFQHKALAKKQINALLLRELDDDCFSSIQFFDYWDISIRQARLVARSSCVFSFFGYDVAMPLSDQRFIRYFFSAPLENRYNEKLYRETLVEHYFKPFGVDFDLKVNKKFKRENRWLKLLKSKAPQLIKKIYYPLNDGIFYREITGELLVELDKNELIIPYLPNKYNSFIIQWYLKFIFGSGYKNLIK